MSTYELMERFDVLNKVKDTLKQRVLKDYYVDGKCSECGRCCSRLLPLSKKDIKRMKLYVTKHNVAHYHKYRTAASMAEHFDCPFCNPQDVHRCNIYEARPTICRMFSCKENPHGKLPGAITNYQLYDMYELFNIN